jgi:hypothetical protein
MTFASARVVTMHGFVIKAEYVENGRGAATLTASAGMSPGSEARKNADEASLTTAQT